MKQRQVSLNYIVRWETNKNIKLKRNGGKAKIQEEDETEPTTFKMKYLEP